MTMTNDFAVFILTHGRPDKVYTFKQLRKLGYTGRVYIIIDNEDKTAERYRRLFGDSVIVFDKAAVAATVDEGDNFGDRRAILYARKACFDIAKSIGVKYFVQLDDDYTDFRFKYGRASEPLKTFRLIRDLNRVFASMVRFLKDTGATSVAMAQCGDFIGGANSSMYCNPRYRKCMNSFFCDADRPFEFFGRMNEDVSTYVVLGGRGRLFLTVPYVALNQRETQITTGGMSEMYRRAGTYVKSFYSVMYNPSCVSIRMMGALHPRIHHQVIWEHAVPKIIEEKHRR